MTAISQYSPVVSSGPVPRSIRGMLEMPSVPPVRVRQSIATFCTIRPKAIVTTAR